MVAVVVRIALERSVRPRTGGVAAFRFWRVWSAGVVLSLGLLVRVLCPLAGFHSLFTQALRSLTL